MSWKDTEKKPAFKNMTRYTDVALAATTHNGSIYIVWQDRQKNALYWARSEPSRTDHGEFFNIFPVRTIADEGEDMKAMTSPALIESENGVLHMIVAEADYGGALSHLQFDDLSRLWTKRVGVGMTVQSAPAVAAINGRIYCVARKASGQDDDELYMSVWDDLGGWSKTRVVTYPDPKGGQPLKPLASAKAAFVQLGDQFHLIFPSKSTPIQLRLDPDARTWTRVPDSAVLKETVSSGLGSAAQPNLNYGFVGYGWRGFGSDFPIVSVSQYNTTTWQVREGLNATTKSNPVLVIILGWLYCFWVDSADNQIMRSRRLVDVGTDDWMSRIADDKPIYALSIPGTHDSAATKEFQTFLQRKFPWFQKDTPYVETQRMTIAQQLYHGIRFLDLRLSMKDSKELMMVHSVVGLNITFASVMADITAFLKENKREALIVSMKNDDNTPSATFQAAVRTVVEANPALWYDGTTLPKLGQCRGQLILLRRFLLDAPIKGVHGQPIGFDLFGEEKWPTNTREQPTEIGPNTTVTIQDRYNFQGTTSLNDQLDAKWGFVKAILERSQTTDLTKSNLFLNFVSATGPLMFNALDFATGGFYMPEDASKYKHVEGMNQKLWNWLRNAKGLKRLGVVVLDYPEMPADLVSAIIDTNPIVR